MTNLAKTDKSEQNGRDYDSLEAWQQYAIDLRLDGYLYRQITILLNQILTEGKKKEELENLEYFKESRIRTWFMSGGLCEYAYRQKKKERAKERSNIWKEVKEQIRDGAVEAIATLKRRMRSKNEAVSTRAAENFIRLAELEPEQKIKHKNDEENPIPGPIFYMPNNGRDATRD
jgi:hypothetical protein